MYKKVSWDWDKSKLKATEFSTVEDKIKFGNQFMKFFDGEFQKKDFPKWFYNRLSMTFGMIGHYNQNGFYEYFFEREENQGTFIHMVLNYGCWGQPEYTFCDIEKQIQEYIKGEK